MQKLTIICQAVILLLLLSSCGGSNTTPSTMDLAGLEGTWDYLRIFQGSMTGPGRTYPVDDSSTGYYIISRNSVIDEQGFTYEWSFDGTLLILTCVIMDIIKTLDCGEATFTVTLNMKIPLSPGSTTGNIVGNCPVTMNTQLCGEFLGTIDVTGHMTKR